MNARCSRRAAVARTEERILPAVRRVEDQMLAEHWARYRFAARSSGGRVLDLGCGTGYGARQLARAGRLVEVIGLDVSPAALRCAARYYADPRVHHRWADLERPGWECGLGRFDRIVAFEILEHLRREGPFWRGIDRALKPGGALWLSTPLGRGRGRPCADPFHVHQLRRSEVAELFAGGWEATFFGQTGIWIEPWIPGRRYYTIVVRARKEGGAGVS